jgi:ABC-type nitrate/sulfonate/bicarbonate transport system ATPase subunit
MSDVLVHVRGATKHLPSVRRSNFRLGPVSLDIQPAEVLLITGPNGCGKTTLLECIADELPLDEGCIEVTREMLYMSQDYRRLLLPWATVQQHLLTACARNQTWERCEPLIPATLQAKRDTPSYRLSGGQLQALCFLQCLMADKPVVLLDEPFSNLDARTTEFLCDQLLGAVKRSKAGAIVCAHAPPEPLCNAAIRHQMVHGHFE